ncbi:hypothetical protein [Nocardioides pyridinolyticus]
MAAVTAAPGLPLWSDHTAFLRRQRRLLGLSIVLGVLAGLVWSLQQPSAYAATASVALAPVPVYVAPSTDGLVPPEVSVDTDAQLLGSGPVLDAIAEVLGTDPDGAADRLVVTATANTHVLHVTVSADTPEDAARAANAAVAALADVRRQALGALDENQLRYLRMVLDNHDVAPDQDDGKTIVFPLEDEQFARIVGVRATLDELDEARAAPVEVVRPAEPPRHAQYANTEVALTSGALLGLLAGCLIGRARDHLRSSASPAPTPTPIPTPDEDHCHA